MIRILNIIHLDKRLNKDFSKINKNNTSSENLAYKLEMMTYKRICAYNIKKEFYSYIVGQFYYSSVRKELSKYFQHGNTTIMKHCRNVAYLSFSCALILEKRFKLNFDYESLIIGAFLHDFFMYDWHEKSSNHRLHGFSHPKTASQNAQTICNIDKKKQSIIESHMWPLTITKIPKSKEAFLVCLFDKYAAFLETFKFVS